MQSQIKKLALIVGLAATTSQAFGADYDTSILVGRKWDEKVHGSGGSKANAVDVSAHVAPMPEIPVSVGAVLSYDAYDKKDFPGVKSLNGYEGGAEVMGWVPLGDWKPYAKARYTLWSQLTEKGEDGTKTHGTTPGAHFALGTKWSPAPHVDLLAEAGYGVQMVKMGGATEPFNSKEFLIGAGYSF